MMILNIINTLSIIVIALVCAMTIIKFHRDIGILVTVAIFLFMLSCVSLAFDEYNGSRGFWALPIFRVLAAAASATAYYKLRNFWSRYGVFIRALQIEDKAA